MTRNETFILPFSEIRAADLPLVGGKGANQGELEQDVAGLFEGFKRGKRLGLMIRNEKAGENEFTSSRLIEPGYRRPKEQ